jgi:hypothetical protein
LRKSKGGLAQGLAALERSVETLAGIIPTRSADYTALLTRGAPMRPVDGAPTDRA